ncbi:MAG: hypothetical protein KDD73_09340 [Anaerolineales bacterium]|nr:hypothetical protein [Anaerolineales bacterium]MCB9127495.1 hypothetical protein [Ardenticatenales bacterium]
MEENQMNLEDSAAASAKPTWYPGLLLLAALGILVAYGLFINLLLNRIDSPEPAWSRYIMLFGSVEAIVFTAVGFLFGQEVNRERAEGAEEKAQNQQDRATRYQREAEKGVELAAAAKAINRTQFHLESVLPNPETTARVADESLKELGQLADRLFPEVNSVP